MSGDAFKQWAAHILKGGYSPVPLHGKRPVFDKWDRLRSKALTPTEIKELCRKYGAMNLGVAGGFNCLAPVDIDTDDHEITLAIAGALPPAMVAKAGRKGFTAFYWDSSGMIGGAKFKRRLPDGGFDMLVEILVTGQTVLPPSMHPETRKPYVWKTRATLFNTRVDELPEISQDHIEALRNALERWIPKPSFVPQIVEGRAVARSGRRMEAYAKAIMAGEVKHISALPCGRNWALYVAACKLGRYVHANILTQSEFEAALMGASKTNGYLSVKHGGPRQALATIRSGLKVSAGDALPLLGPRQQMRAAS